MKLISIVLLCLCAWTGNAQFFNDWRDISSAVATAAGDPNADLNTGVYTAFLLDDGGAVGGYPNDVTDTVHGFLLSVCNTAVSQAAGFGNIPYVADFHTAAPLDPSSARGFGNAAGSGHTAATLSANQVFSVTAWVKLSNTTANNPIFDDWDSTGFYMGQSGGNKWTFGLHKGDNSTVFVDDNTLSGGSGSTDTGTWHLMAGGWDGSHIWISMDGGTKNTSAAANTHAFTGDLAIGKYADSCGTSIPTDGFIGVCICWTNRTLSVTELGRIFNSRNGIAPVHGGPF